MGQRGSRQPENRVLILGLDNAGKSTLLYKLKHNASVITVPTIGFNVEMIEARRRRNGRQQVAALTVWDVGGQRNMRRHWKEFYPDTAAMVWVLDSSDGGRFDEARRELEHALRSMEHLMPGGGGGQSGHDVPVVVLANKQDASGALSVTDITERLDFRALFSGRDWFVQPCSAATGFGLEEGFRRVAQLMRVPSEAGAIKDNIKETVHYLREKSITSMGL